VLNKCKKRKHTRVEELRVFKRKEEKKKDGKIECEERKRKQ
jgi:hypothetical protein